MSNIPILSTKLYIPARRANVVPRPRLIDRLNAGLNGKLTLISAPAGFGKTTLVSEWLAHVDRPIAWLSLDDADNDPARFLAYIVAALQTVKAGLGAAILNAVEPTQSPSETLLTALLNEISTVERPFILALDDYHVIDAAPVDQALTFIIEHLPPQLHIVITTREDPQLPLARLRARGLLNELRAADLRFTPQEAASFLNQAMGLALSADDIGALEARTEGWAAGLQLAALSLRGIDDPSEFIRAFAGDHRYIVDYLVEEVLQRQPEAVRRFLLQTAILDRLNGSLCDAVTGQSEGNARLDALVRGNFFIVPLDDKRQWFRYHHLFADVLRAHLIADEPDRVAALHLRASMWFERNGSADEAIRHALAAEDFGRAADLIELAVPVMRKSRQEATMLSWLRALPADLFVYRPVLSAHFAGTVLQSGQLEGVEDLLRNAERWLKPAVERDLGGDSLEPMVVVDHGEFQTLASSIAMYRAAIALATGDSDNTIKYARQIIELAAEDDHFRHGAAAAMLGLTAWARGDLEAAHKSYGDGMARLQKAGFVADVIGGAIALGDIRIAQGRLSEAMRTYERGIQLATSHGAAILRGAADMHTGLSTICYERGDLSAAAQHLTRSKELGEGAALPQNRHRWRMAAARLRAAEGDLDGAYHLLDEAERLYTSDLIPNVRPIDALKARLLIEQGRLSEALGWARERNLSSTDDHTILNEFEHITLARLFLAQHNADPSGPAIHEAVRLLERLLQAAEEGERRGSVIEILVLLALARQMQGNTSAALAALERALIVAEPEGYIRLFVDEGEPLAALLEKAAKHRTPTSYVGQLLTAFGKSTGRSPLKQALIEPLSERELDVLRLLGSDMDGPDMARELSVSLNTVRTHTKNIYSKLGVNNRRTAVRRAEELGLL